MQAHPIEQDASGPQGWVLYDGECGLCSRSVLSMGPRLAKLGLAVASLQEPWVAARIGLPPGDLLTDVRLLLRDGRLLAGADVYRYVMRRLWWTWPLYLLAVAPGLRHLFDLAYRAVAERRHRISKACGLERKDHDSTGSRRG